MPNKTRSRIIDIASAIAGVAVIVIIEVYVVSHSHGYWIELFNGATWPGQFAQPVSAQPHDFLFYFVLSCRTILNLGIALTAISATYWILTGGARRYLMRTVDSVSQIRDTALTGYLIHFLNEKGVTISVEIEDMLYEAAEKFSETEAGKHFLTKALSATREAEARDF